MKRLKILMTLLLLVSCAGAGAQFKQGAYRIYGWGLPYLVSFPDNYDASKEYPLVVFLHGAGQRGEDNQQQTAIGKDYLLGVTKSRFPAILILPQCPSYSFWSNIQHNQVEHDVAFSFGHGDEPSVAMKILMPFITEWINSGKVDKSRVYISGVSMGGLGTYELLWRMPNTFAAAFMICGGGEVSTQKLEIVSNTPLWLFHGDKDNILDVKFSRDIYDGLKSIEAKKVKYTEYKGMYHGIWDKVFEEEELAPWLFNHKKQ